MIDFEPDALLLLISFYLSSVYNNIGCGTGVLPSVVLSVVPSVGPSVVPSVLPSVVPGEVPSVVLFRILL